MQKQIKRLKKAPSSYTKQKTDPLCLPYPTINLNVCMLHFRHNGLLILFAFGFHCLFGQNLVPNAGFEYYYECPSDHDQLDRAIGWYKTNMTTPDFFHECNKKNQSFFIPNNVFGSKETFEGDGYAGMVCRSMFREYLMVRLKEPLVAGQEYNAYMHVSLSDASTHTVHDIGMYFSANPIFNTDFKPITGVRPQVNNTKGRFIQPDQWHKIEGSFVAKGGERYLILGNFRYRYETAAVNQTGNGVTEFPYFYVDNVSTSPIRKLVLHKDINAINNLDNVYFESGQATLIPGAAAALDSLVAVLRKNPDLQLTVTGHTDSLGSASLNQQLSESRARTVANYLIQNGIKSERLVVGGKGYTAPLVRNNSEKDRQLNRRVTFNAVVKEDT